MGTSVDELFMKRLPVLTKSQDREDRLVHIQITVETHTLASPVHRRELVVRLTDEADLFFLFTLKLSEEDFQSLKMQQGLLVDFGAFPQKFIDLLNLCLEEEHKEMPKFIIHLISNGASGTSAANLNLIETNPFKHLTHLSLKFLPGTDGDVKKYLASCLKALKDQNELLLHKLEHTESDLSGQLRQAREALANRTQELDALKADWSAKTSGLTSRHTQELNSEREKALQVQTSVHQKLDRDKRELEQAHMKIVKQLEAKLYDLDTANKDLMDQKYKSEATIRELRSRLGLLEEENHRTKQDIQNLRKNNAALDHDHHDQDKTINQLRTRLAVLEQEIKDKEEVMRRTSDLLATEQDQKKKQEEELDRKKRNLSKLEGTIKKLSEDIIKGNEIIKKLQGEIKHYHSKLKLRNQVTTEQEKLLVDKNREMEEIRRELERSKSQLSQKEDESKKLNESLENTMSKLEESRQLLKTNENVINWLNKQVTDSQLSSHRGHGPFELTSNSTGSTFRPAAQSYSTPSMSYGAHSIQSRMSAPISNQTPPQNRPQVHYNPSQPRKSAIPHPIAKSSPIGPIPEEVPRQMDVQASPALTQNSQIPREPLLDDKYFQQPGNDPPLRGASTAHRSISPTPFRITSQTPPMSSASAHTNRIMSHTPPVGSSATHPNRLSKDLIIPKHNTSVGSGKPPQPPLASAYFPGNTKVS